MSSLLSVNEGLERILRDVHLVSSERVPLRDAGSRILSEPLVATRTQPPFPASAMDGYAVRAQDIAQIPCVLKCIGESAAGNSFEGYVGENECVRIFTGAPVPVGADTIVIQENVQVEDDTIRVLEGEEAGRYVRKAGGDFEKGDAFFEPGHQLGSPEISLAAAMNLPLLPVFRRPRVAIIATGDELVLPGEDPGCDQIVASNSFGVAEIISKAGGEAVDLGIAKDTMAALDEKLELASDCDLVITLGGASVGDHDLVHAALKKRNVSMDFWKLAMRPGKPVMFGRSADPESEQRFIGLPGNPVSSLVCSLIFIVPLLKKWTGRSTEQEILPAQLAIPLPENDRREEYMRASSELRGGTRYVTPFPSQDSSLITVMAKADCLIIRPAHAPPTDAGADCQIIPL